MRNHFWLLAVLLSLASAANANEVVAGNEGGNGGDTLISGTGSAWAMARLRFEPLRFCVDVSSNFAFSPADNFLSRRSTREDLIKYITSNSIQIWGFYMADRKIELQTPSGAYYPRTGARLVDCDKDPHVKFFFGSENEDLKRLKALYNDPIGFAHRTSFDPTTGEGTGIIWISPMRLQKKSGPTAWNDDTLMGILLHELGHSFGCEHVTGTVMDADILGRLSEPRFGLNIDEERMLTLSSDAEHHRTFALLDSGGQLSHSPATVEALSKVFGEQPRFPLSTWVSENQTKDRSLTILYRHGTEPQKKFVIKLEPDPIQTPSEARVFQMTAQNQTTFYPGGNSYIFFGKIAATAGDLPVMVQLNSLIPSRKISIWLLFDGKKALIH